MEGEAAHHLGRVLRAQAGQLYELSDGKRVWLGRIDRVTRDRVEFSKLEELQAYQPPLDLTLLLAVVKFDSFEWALEKSTELGIGAIVPLAAARSEKALLGAAAKRAERWKKILLEASQQCRRVRVPVLADVSEPGRAFASFKDGLRVMLSERADAPPLRKVLEGRRGAEAVLANGRGGGWTDAGREGAHRGGFREASRGRVILRAETAQRPPGPMARLAFAPRRP